jgi:hypothetical protein
MGLHGLVQGELYLFFLPLWMHVEWLIILTTTYSSGDVLCCYSRLHDGVVLGLSHCGMVSLKEQRVHVKLYVKLGKTTIETHNMSEL